MHLVSFDVGIKNMAYCVMDVGTGIITDWSVLNLMPPPPPPPPTCCACSRLAKFCTPQDPCFAYCRAHAQKRVVDAGIGIFPDKAWSPTALAKKTVGELRTMLTDRHLEATSASKADCLACLRAWVKDTMLVPTVTVATKSANDTDLIAVGRRLGEELDAAVRVPVDHVIIENQIGPLASRMRALQGMLTQYFLIRHPSAQIHYISSANKLKDWRIVVDHQPQTYRQRKIDSVASCLAVLRANPTLGYTPAFVDTHGKKDDLADCFLQAMWFWKHGLQTINWTAEDLKIKFVV